MCTITTKTVVRANMASVRRQSVARHDDAALTDGRIRVSVSHHGRRYSSEITLEQLQASYGKARQTVIGHGKKV